MGFVAGKKNDGYLRFDPQTTCILPEIRDNSKPLMMYIHIPFCEELCNYCSFHKVAFYEDGGYFGALRKEIIMHKEKGHKFQSVYFGGGTPTILMPELLETIVLLKKLFNINEFSIETNPNHLDVEHLQPLKDMGINRLSVGVQSFDDEILKATGRYHKYGSGEEIISKIAAFQDFFPTFNIDMMFNFPIQTKESLEKDIEIIKKLKVSQVTYYPLMISSSTHKEIEQTMGKVDNKRGRAFYKLISEALSEDYQAATAWCFNRKYNKSDSQAAENKVSQLVDEYVINYNEYAGVGSGAIGFLEGSIYANTFNISEYVERIEKGEFPIIARRNCTKREMLLYDFLMQLFGLSLDLEQVSRKHGVNAFLWLFPEIMFFKLIGGIKNSPQNNVLLLKNRYYWVIMMREFFTSVNNFREYCRLKSKTN